MVFNSSVFLKFFAVVYLVYRLLPFKWQNRMLLLAGYVFYGAWDFRFVLDRFLNDGRYGIGKPLSAQNCLQASQTSTYTAAPVFDTTLREDEPAMEIMNPQWKYQVPVVRPVTV
jgi:hypothetical protein